MDYQNKNYMKAKDFMDEIMTSNLMHMERVARLKLLLDTQDSDRDATIAEMREALAQSKRLMDYWKSHHPIEWEKEDEEVYQLSRAILAKYPQKGK